MNARTLLLLVAALKAFDRAHERQTCTACGATWDDDATTCRWCEAANRRLVDDERRAILWPAWAEGHGPRYDELDELDRQVWDQTRGVPAGTGQVKFWAGRLRRALDAGIVTMHEADAALRRIEAWQNASTPTRIEEAA